MLDAADIARLLQPFLGEEPISPQLVAQLQTYLDLLLRWNARTNLTAVRDPGQIVTRHFGESLFAARLLRDAGLLTSSLADFGSGAGFPGVPIKLFAPEIQLTLLESQNKKATFLREVIRALNLPGAEVFCGRAESWNRTANVVTLRAVEKFESALPIAASLVSDTGILCLLIGTGQVPAIRQVLSSARRVGEPEPVPSSEGRVVILARPF